MSPPLLSVVVPTRERAHTLGFTLRSALAQASGDLELVVSDNASEDETEAEVRAIADPRLTYFNTGRRLSMCDNYEFALERAHGRHVLFVGDDDAVLPGRLDLLLARLRAEPEPAIYMWPLHIYDWPGEGSPARLAFRAPARPERIMDLGAKARAVMRAGGWKYYEMPSPYHCAIPVRILNGIRERTGRVFHSTQPDVFTAMAIPAFAESAVSLGVPITFHGRSAQSNGADFAKRGPRANIDRFIREYGDYEFHPTLPQSAAASAKMIPDAILRARDFFPEVYEAAPFNYSAMWAYMCRLGFASVREVVANAGLFRRAHPFGLAEFLGFSAVHGMAALRRNLIDLAARDPYRGRAPDNILDFARALASV